MSGTPMERLLVRLLHPTPHALEPAAWDEALAPPPARLKSLAGELHREVDLAARRLLEDPRLAPLVSRMPFAPGSVVVGIGDELVSDLHSWFELVARMHRMRCPERAVRFVNAGGYGRTTSDLLSRMDRIGKLAPTHVFCLAGVSDLRRCGSPLAPRPLSAEDTERNLFLMREALPDADWLTLVPFPTTIRSRGAPIRSSPLPLAPHWNADDLDALRGIVRCQDTPTLDADRHFAAPAGRRVMERDGVHPTLLGHVRVARSVIRATALGGRCGRGVRGILACGGAAPP